MQESRGRFQTLPLVAFLALYICCSATPAASHISLASPAAAPEPYEPWGSVTVDGSPAPDGTLVTGSVPGASVETATADGWYILSIPGDDPDTAGDDGGEMGDLVVFTVDGRPASATGSWSPGGSDRIDLSVDFSLWYEDADSDGFGNPNVTEEAASAPPGYVADGTDCDDQDPDEFPGQNWYKDADGDGHSDGISLIQCERPEAYYTLEKLPASPGQCA